MNRAKQCFGLPAFQSTHPLRGATDRYAVSRGRAGISIHAPLAGCDAGGLLLGRRRTNFNPRTPCGVRLRACFQAPSLPAFQSTHPLRGATCFACSDDKCEYISIHAPLAGCDCGRVFRLPVCLHFNPRTPCGVRHALHVLTINANIFQSTHPLRGATKDS